MDNDKAILYLVMFLLIGAFFLGGLAGKWQDRWVNRKALALTADEAVTLLLMEYARITKENDTIAAGKTPRIQEVNKVCTKLESRLYDKDVKSAYKLYASRDSIISDINSRK